MGKLSMKSPSDVAAKWSRNLSGATQSIQAGVNAVTVAPTQLAAAQGDAYLQGIQRSYADGKWQAGLRRVSLQDWQGAMLNKGVARIAQGATSGKPKVEAFMNQLLPYVQQQQRALASVPRGSLEQNIQRMTMFTRGMSQFKRTQ